MVQIRQGGTHHRGRPVDVVGEQLQVGQKAPDFELVAQDMSSVTLNDTSGRVRIVSTVPSLDTPVCAAETRRWEEEIARLDGKAEVITVSMDTPFAQRRWCKENCVAHRVLSAYHEERFGEDWGVLIRVPPLRRVLQRAIFVLDRNDTIRYADYCPEIADQPDFERPLEVASELV